MNINNFKTSNFDEDSNNDIELKNLLGIFIRNKKLLVFINLLGILFAIIFSYTAKPIWRGGFDIVVNEKKNEDTFSRLNLLSLSMGMITNENETQKFILKSQSVLLPVFNFVKKDYEKKGKNTDQLYFEEWVNNDLEIDYETGTNILYVNFKNSDKDLIIKVLGMISEKYKSYSQRQQLKALEKTKLYLEREKKRLAKEANISQKAFNKFSIDNGLGNIDGFVSLDSGNIGGSPNLNQIAQNLSGQNGISLSNLRKTDSAGQRYKNQYNQLELYEAKYTDLSSKLKPNSIVLKELKLKINNLKNALKRPNEILIEYKNLSKASERDETLLARVSETLEFVKLEANKTPDAWELVSEPQIEKNKIFPNKKNILFYSLLSSFMLGVLICLIKEKSLDIVFEFNSLKNKINTNYLLTLEKKDKLLNDELFEIFLKKEGFKNIGFVNYLNNCEFSFFEGNFSNEKFEVIDFDSINKSLSKKKYFLIIQEAKIKYQQLNKLNKYLSIYEDCIIGWIFIKTT